VTLLDRPFSADDGPKQTVGFLPIAAGILAAHPVIYFWKRTTASSSASGP
jgi:hypothetical protein